MKWLKSSRTFTALNARRIGLHYGESFSIMFKIYKLVNSLFFPQIVHICKCKIWIYNSLSRRVTRWYEVLSLLVRALIKLIYYVIYNRSWRHQVLEGLTTSWYDDRSQPLDHYQYTGNSSLIFKMLEDFMLILKNSEYFIYAVQCHFDNIHYQNTGNISKWFWFRHFKVS